MTVLTAEEAMRDVLTANPEEEVQRQQELEQATGDQFAAKHSMMDGAQFWSRLPKNISKGMYFAAINTIDAIDSIAGAGAAGNPTGGAAVMMGEAMRKEAEGDETPIDAADVSPQHTPPLRTLYPEAMDALQAYGETLQEDNTFADGMTQGVTQFAVPFAGYLKMMGGLQKGQTLANVGKLATAEAATAGTAFDAHEVRVADLIDVGRQMDNDFGRLLNEVSPDGSLLNTYINYITDRENESEWEGRWKNAVDSVGATAAVTGILKAAGVTLKTSSMALREAGTGPVAGSPGAQKGMVGFHGSANPRSASNNIDDLFSLEQVSDNPARSAFGHGIYVTKHKDIASRYTGTGEAEEVLSATIDDATVARFLDRGSDFASQPENVKAALTDAVRAHGNTPVFVLDAEGRFVEKPFAAIVNEDSGGPIYDALANVLGGKKQASEWLAANGVPGANAPSANSVVLFSNDIIDEVRRGNELLFRKGSE